MDVFDSWHICNHTDEEGRYSYKASSNFLCVDPNYSLTPVTATTGDGVRRRQCHLDYSRYLYSVLAFMPCKRYFAPSHQ